MVVSYAFWQRHFGGAADVIGRPLVLNRVTLTVIGVTPPEFTGIEQGQTYDVALPLGLEPLMRGSSESALDHRSWWWLRVMARLKPGQSVEQGTAALRGVQPQLREATIPEDWRPDDAVEVSRGAVQRKAGRQRTRGTRARVPSSRCSRSWRSSRWSC